MAAGPDAEAYVKLAVGIFRAAGHGRQDPRAVRRPRASSPTSRRCSPTRATDARDARPGRGRPAGRRGADRGAAAARSRSCCCPRTRPTRRTPSSKSAPAPAATRRRCSPAICSACTSATPPRRAGGRGRVGERGRGRRLQGNHRHRVGQGRLRPAEVRIRRPPRAARAGDRGAAAASTPRRRRWRCCRRPRRSTSRSAPTTSASTRCAPRAPAASTSTPPTRRCASPICRPASWWCRRRSRSTRTGRAPCRSCARGSTTWSAARPTRSARESRKLPGRLRRPLGAHPHLQFPAGPRHRPPHQPDALQARPGDDGRTRRDHLGADLRPPVEAARQCRRRWLTVRRGRWPSCWRRRAAALAEAGIADAALEARLIVEHFSGTEPQPRRSRRRSGSIADDAVVANRAGAAAATQRRAGAPHPRLSRVLRPATSACRRKRWSRGPIPKRSSMRCCPSSGRRRERRGRHAASSISAPAPAPSRWRCWRECRDGDGGRRRHLRRTRWRRRARNAEALGLGARFTALQSDWFAEISGEFHVIASNPPYIPTNDLAGLQAEVRNFDPARALDGGADGLDAYRIIAAKADRFLAPAGVVGVEIGYTQKHAVTQLFEAAGYRTGRGAAGHRGTRQGVGFPPLTLTFPLRKKRLAIWANAARVPAPDETKQAVLLSIRFPFETNCLLAKLTP